MQSKARDNERQGIDHQGVATFLAFMYFVPWLLLLPFGRWLSLAGLSTASRPVTSELGALDEDFGAEEADSSCGKSHNAQNNSVERGALFEKSGYLAKLVVLSFLLLVAVFSYMNSLSLTPAFDVSLVQNTSIFEITSLLYGVCGLTRRKNVFRNFLLMMVALIGILLVSYTKATCDVLAGKFSINEKTGELNDPFLFDRLKSCLLCGLGALTLGPVAVLWNRWFNYSHRITISHQCQHLTFIASICMVALLPSLPNALSTMAKVPTDRAFWLGALVTIFLGTLPHIFSLLQIQRQTFPSYSTTVNLGAIIFMGISDWICEPKQTTVLRWEVVGYVMLTISCVVLSVTYYEKKHISLY